jgi:hypothetical protein
MHIIALVTQKGGTGKSAEEIRSLRSWVWRRLNPAVLVTEEPVFVEEEFRVASLAVTSATSRPSDSGVSGRKAANRWGRCRCRSVSGHAQFRAQWSGHVAARPPAS